MRPSPPPGLRYSRRALARVEPGYDVLDVGLEHRDVAQRCDFDKSAHEIAGSGGAVQRVVIRRRRPVSIPPSLREAPTQPPAARRDPRRAGGVSRTGRGGRPASRRARCDSGRSPLDRRHSALDIGQIMRRRHDRRVAAGAQRGEERARGLLAHHVEPDGRLVEEQLVRPECRSAAVSSPRIRWPSESRRTGTSIGCLAGVVPRFLSCFSGPVGKIGDAIHQEPPGCRELRSGRPMASRCPHFQ